MTSAAPTAQVFPARLLVVLALLSAIAPFSTDLYLSAFPLMTTDLSTTATGVQLSLTAFLVGIAVGQFVFGPVSDRFGRWRPLVVGAALCVVASVVAALAPTLAVLVIARLVQGVAGAAGLVIGRAIISDLASGPAAARAFSLTMLVGGVAPVIAPFAGSLLVAPLGWRGILGVIAGLAALMLVAVLVVLRETHPVERRATGRRSGASGLGSRAYLANMLTFVFAFGVLMAYISASPFVYQSMIGLGAVGYGVAFAVNSVGLVAVSAVSARLVSRVPAGRLASVGVVLIVAFTLALLVLVTTGAPAWTYAIALFGAVSSLGLVFGNATALALAAVPHSAGLASAVLGALQFGLAALVSPLVSLAGETTALPLAIVMVVAALASGVALLIARRVDEPLRLGTGQLPVVQH